MTDAPGAPQPFAPPPWTGSGPAPAQPGTPQGPAGGDAGRPAEPGSPTPPTAGGAAGRPIDGADGAAIRAREAWEHQDRLSLVVAVLLATLGVLGAFVSWRIGQLGSDAESESRAALAARRERSAAGVEAAAQVTQASADWLSYELARRKAEALRAAGQNLEALRWDREAAAFWGGVPNTDIGLDGSYDPAAHQDALVAATTDGLDVDPDPHLQAATLAESRANRFGQLGFALAAVLPILTLAEVSKRRRLRLALALLGAAGLAAGIAWLVTLWA